MNPPYAQVGRSPVRIDGLEKVTGAATYVDDIDFGPGLLHGAIVESPHAHARILSIDASEAERLPGVVRVVTSEDFPYHFGLYMKDRYIFARDRVRFVGEQVAGVIARDPKTAARAARLVRVEYEVLPPILDPMEALEEEGERIHPDLGDYPHVPWFFPKAGTNIAHWRKTRRGDAEAGFAEADFVLEDLYTVPRYAHCAIEPHVIVGLLDPAGRLTLWSSSQSPYTQRHVFAETLAPLGFTHQNVRVITPYVGGGFGGKAGVSMEILGVALAVAAKGRPVKLRFTREQEFVNTYQRQGLRARLKMGVRKDGVLTAMEHTLYWDAGAYVEYGANVVNAAGLSATGPYRIPNLKIDSLCIYTNLPPGGPYRGFGYSEFHFGVESHMNRLAAGIGMDPVEIRRRNAIAPGDPLPYGAPMNPSGLMECIDRAAEAIGWGEKETSDDPDRVLGKGFSLFWKAPAMPPNASSAAFLKFNEDGSVNLAVSGMEIGQGYMTAMAQIAAEVLALPVEKVRVETPDTDRNAYEWQTVGSHVTWSCGNAVLRAAEDAREKIFDLVVRVFGHDRGALFLEGEAVRCRTAPDFVLPYRDFVIAGVQTGDGTFKGGPILGSGIFLPEFASALSDPETSQGGHPNVHYTVGAAGAVLEVDRRTGKMRVRHAVLAVDVGRAIHPELVRGQITGGLVQGFATVLYEDMRFDEKGRLVNPNFTDYKIPTAMDIPDRMTSILVEVPQPDGPFGARGVGEHTMIPAAPLVANALENAVGVRLRDMPITAERVALALRAKERGEAGG
ncbi:MAG: xanthine dehydrogenase family protein molybdopterin-binding subunit [Candidatus Eisenbacteria bacterium]|nr:xanthine dehydrogenase family protein molybdopterin-binding subunit [Candidatus Eisenbacteria bacterium]